MERERERERQGVVDGGVRVTGFSFASNDQPRSPLFGFSTNARLPRLSSILCCVTSAPSAALCAATITKPLDLFYLCLSLSLSLCVCMFSMLGYCDERLFRAQASFPPFYSLFFSSPGPATDGAIIVARYSREKREERRRRRRRKSRVLCVCVCVCGGIINWIEGASGGHPLMERSSSAEGKKANEPRVYRLARQSNIF